MKYVPPELIINENLIWELKISLAKSFKTQAVRYTPYLKLAPPSKKVNGVLMRFRSAPARIRMFAVSGAADINNFSAS